MYDGMGYSLEGNDGKDVTQEFVGECGKGGEGSRDIGLAIGSGGSGDLKNDKNAIADWEGKVDVGGRGPSGNT